MTIRNHPKHELGQTLRREIYNLLRETPEGTLCCRWLAMLSARRVENIFEEATAHWKEEGPDEDKKAWARQAIADGKLWAQEDLVDDWKVAERMNDIAEGVLNNTISTAYASQVASTHYYETVGAFGLGSSLSQKGYLALRAAYNALGESYVVVPLKTELSDGATSSREWEDYRLAGVGANADDAAVDAAFAFAEANQNGDYDSEKLGLFWEWWLTEAIPQAWEKANG